MNEAGMKSFESYMSQLQSEDKIVGVSIAVVSQNELVYAKGFGKAKLDEEAEITPDTIMSIQSITKSFAAISIMSLVEKGLIDLDQPLVNYLPYFQTKSKEESDKITVRQLLSHTSGLPGDAGIANLACKNPNEVSGFKEWKEEVGIPDEVIEGIQSFEDITLYFKNIELAHKPGEKWQYCTDAYAIVGDLFEKVSGESWFDYLQENIFEKLGMSRTTLHAEKAKSDSDRAHFYVKENSSFEETGFPNNPVAAPAGFIYASAKDLAGYLAANMNYEDSPLLQAESLKEMQKPYPGVECTLPFEDVENKGYGLGWGTSIYKGLKLVDHGGGYPGVKAFVSMVPDKKLGVVVLSNYDETNPREISMKLVDLFI